MIKGRVLHLLRVTVANKARRSAFCLTLLFGVLFMDSIGIVLFSGSEGVSWMSNPMENGDSGW